MLRILLAIGLMLAGAVTIALPVQVFGSLDEKFIRDLREARGEVLETYPNGVHKVTRAAIVLGNPGSEQVFEVRTEVGESPADKKRVFKTPTQEFVERWDTAKGWVQTDVMKDQRTLAGKLGLPSVSWPYYFAGFIFIVAGIAVMYIKRRKSTAGSSGR